MKEKNGCMLSGDKNCQEGPKCKTCGWFAQEDRRRKTLPFVEGDDGLLRKIVGRKGSGQKNT